MTIYLTAVEILAIHADQIARFGGRSGVRDAGQLEAALFRPQSGYYSDLIAESAALWESLAQNHPFVDGNKRVAFAAMVTFLAINGIIIRPDPIKTYGWIADLYACLAFRFAEIESWLRKQISIS